jgi:hypothetical protein
VNTQILVFVVVSTSLLGLLLIIFQLLSTAHQLWFTHRFFSAFQKYCQSVGNDINTYRWLMEHSQSMQWAMGEGGILAVYRPAYANYAINNFQIIINMLPEVRQCFEGNFSYRFTQPHIAIVQDTLLRFIGVLKVKRNMAIRALLNPLQWLRLGIQATLSSPFVLLHWVGLVSSASTNRVTGHPIFRIVSGLVTITGFIASVLTLIVERDTILSLIKQVLH